MKALLIFIPGLMIIFGSCGVNRQIKRAKQKINADIQALISEKAAGPFSGSILVARGGSVFVRQNYGFTDIEKTAPITDQSRFNIGSAAKEVSAFAILHLIEQGKLAYTDPINRHLDSLPSWAEKVTIRDLLFYESGLPTLNFLSAKTDELAIRDLRAIDTLEFAPGTAYLYSNWNNFLQAKIVEAIVGVNFQSWIQDNFFDPLGMDGALYSATIPEVTENMTKAFSQAYGDDIANNPNFKSFELCYAPLYMTPQDLFNWVEYVCQRYESPDKATIMPFFQATTVERQGPIGVIKKSEDQVIAHIHGGGSYSFATLIYRDYPDDLTIIIMSNDGYSVDLDQIRIEMLKIIHLAALKK